MIIEIPVDPHPKLRPRAFLRGGFIKMYDPNHNEEKNLKHLLSTQLSEHYPNHTPFDAALSVEIFFVIMWPKSTSKKRRTPVHTVKPDLDNLIKSILDACNGIVWSDDRIITRLIAEKIYGESGSITLKVKTLAGADLRG